MAVAPVGIVFASEGQLRALELAARNMTAPAIRDQLKREGHEVPVKFVAAITAKHPAQWVQDAIVWARDAGTRIHAPKSLMRLEGCLAELQDMLVEAKAEKNTSLVLQLVKTAAELHIKAGAKTTEKARMKVEFTEDSGEDLAGLDAAMEEEASKPFLPEGMLDAGVLPGEEPVEDKEG